MQYTNRTPINTPNYVFSPSRSSGDRRGTRWRSSDASSRHLPEPGIPRRTIAIRRCAAPRTANEF